MFKKEFSPIIMHIDMNSYFASVEQQANPFLRGRPVGVCAYLNENGCIIASSIEAKKFGVKTGMRVREGRVLCPKLFLMENDPAKYRTTTKQIFDLLAEYSDIIEAYSIDEAFIDFTGWYTSYDEVEEKAGEIRERIQKEIGDWLKCSIGISYTKFLAKFASDIASPDSLIRISKDNLDTFLYRRPVMDAWGINKKTAARLEYLGIKTLLDLKKYPVSNLMTVLGKYGYFLWANVNGISVGTVHDRSNQQPKSIGHSYCLPRKTDDLNFLLPILYKLCEKTGRRLREQHLMAQTIFVSMSYREGGEYTKRYSYKDAFDTTEQIYAMAKKIMIRGNQKPLSLLAVGVSNLIPFRHQLSLFSSFKEEERYRAIDRINDKYGEYVMHRGSLCGTQKYAQDRIGFRKTISYF